MMSEPSIRTGLTIVSVGVAIIMLGIIFYYFPLKVWSSYQACWNYL